ncbi:hypothetical protein V866_005593 [Kwoniella sp. B9012]
MTSPVKTSRSTDFSPPKKSNLYPSTSTSTDLGDHRSHHYKSTEEKNMTASVPINIPRMPPSLPSSSHQPQQQQLRDSYERSSYPQSSRLTEPRHRSPSSGRSPPISHSYTRSHPYPRRTSSTSQPERERERERDREQLPRIHLPPPNSIASLKFSERNDQLSPIEREFPSLSTSNQHESSWRNGSSDRPQLHRIPSGGSVGKSAGISLPPLHSISRSPTLPPSLSMPPPPPSLDASSSAGSTARGSPRMYPPNIRAGYNPYETAHQQRRSPSAGGGPPPKLREREYEHQAVSTVGQSRRSSREDLYEQHRRPSITHIQTTVALPNHPPNHPHHHPHNQHHPSSVPIHGYDIPSPPLRALPPSSMPALAYPPPYGHRNGGGGDGSAILARSRSHSSTSGFSRGGPVGMEADDSMGMGVGVGGVAPTAGQTRRLAHLMSEQKRRESINSGFQALRQAIPSFLPTDSKAIILRKAVSHITHLENIIRRSGLTYSDSPPPGGGGPSEGWSNDENGNGRDRNMLADDDESSSGPRIKWEDER